MVIKKQYVCQLACSTNFLAVPHSRAALGDATAAAQPTLQWPPSHRLVSAGHTQFEEHSASVLQVGSCSGTPGACARGGEGAIKP